MRCVSVTPWFEGEGDVPRGIHYLASAKGNHGAGQEVVITRITPILVGREFEDLTLACKKCGDVFWEAGGRRSMP